MDKLSVSAANLFKSCPRQFYYKEILGWEPAKKPAWLTKGSAYDKLLEYYDLGGILGANEHIPELFPNQFEQVDARFVLAHYHEKFGNAPLPPVEGGNQHGFGVVYRGNEVTGPVEYKVTGYIDKVSQVDDELVVTERKTTSEPIEDGSEYWSRLPLDEQIRCYPWALKALGNNAGKVVYEVLRKPSTTVSKVFDKKGISLADYTERLLSAEIKKTLVARRTIYVTQDMCDDFIVSHTMTYLNIQRCKQKQAEIEAMGYDGMYAWQKHQNACGDYGGCFARDVDEGKVTFERGDFVKSEKWLKKNGGI